MGSSWATVGRKSAQFLDVVDERMVAPNTYPCPDIQNLWRGPNLENISADVIKLRTLRWERPPGVIQMGPHPVSNVLLRDTQRRGGRKVTTEVEIGMSQPQAHASGHKKLEETRNRISPRASGGSAARLTPWFPTSALQNWERVHFCCVKPPS